MLTIGDQFPPYALKAVVSIEPGHEFADITNLTHAGQWRVVFFWPKDFTFVCPTEIAGFAELDREVRAALTNVRSDIMIAMRFSHVYPDGPAPYYTFGLPADRGREIEQHEAIKRAVSDAIARAGGTITHHHAVGRLHEPWYARERPAPFEGVLRACKRVLDPASIMNPGVLLHEP